MSSTDEPEAGDARYRAPRTQVDDRAHTVDSRPPIAVSISVLLFSGTIVGLLVPMVSNWHQLFDFEHGEPAAAAFAVTFVLINTTLVAMIFRGANWARYLSLVFYLLTLAVIVLDRHWDLEVTLYLTAQTIALILLFTPQARAWFHRLDS